MNKLRMTKSQVKNTKVLVTEDNQIIVVPPRKKWSGAGINPKCGFKKGNPTRFRSGKDPRVIKSHELDARVKTDMTKTRIKLLSHAYRIELGDDCTVEGFEHLTWAEAIAKGLVKVAQKGDVAAAKELREVTEGKLPETVRWEDNTPAKEVEEIDSRIRELLDNANGRREAGAAEAAGKKKPAPKAK